ncbi:MAG: hypothetical protein ACTHJT_01595 [Cytophaga sp.]|uniref:NHL domain-containing protein n=1 Tax=Cytophaga sp. TaxID=29535 RepID=UPI003F7EC046
MNRISILLFALSIFSFSIQAQKYQVTTLAGYTHDADGVKERASFNQPQGIFIDKSGSIYVADSWNYKIRKITPDGMVSTIAGSMYGYPSIIPVGITSDNNGNIYISSKHQIYKINAEGDMTSFAGSEEDGDKDGANALFYNIHGIACDDSGNVFVADASNDKIKKITPEGYVTTYAGMNNDSHSDSLLYYPHSLVFDKKGNLFVTDEGNACLKKIIAGKSMTRFPAVVEVEYLTEEDYENAMQSSFYSPTGITIDQEDNLFVVDKGNTIKKITKDGIVSVIPISFTDQVPSFGQLSCIAVDTVGCLYVTDKINNQIYKISQTGTLELFAGCGLKSFDGPAAKAFFNTPAGMVMDKKGNLFVSDKKNHNIRKIDIKGNVTTFAGAGNKGRADGKGTEALFNEPMGLAIDKKGNIYVADKGNNKIRIIRKNGLVETFAQNTASDNHFAQPIDICIDSKDNIYVLNEHASQIKIIDKQKNITTLVSTPALGINNYSMSIDQNDNLYITTINETVVLKITPDRTLLKVEDNTNTRPLDFRYPRNTAIDKAGNLYVAPLYSHQIYVADPKGNIFLTIGNSLRGYNDGDIDKARFCFPDEILVDDKGNIYVIDTGNNVIRKIIRTEE